MFESDLAWLVDEPSIVAPADGSMASVGRLLIVDRQSILASSFIPGDDGDGEHAIYGGGFGNSLVVIMRRLLAAGLPVAGPDDAGDVAAVESPGDEGTGEGTAAGSGGRE